MARQAERGRGLCPWLKTERWKRFMSASTADDSGTSDAHIRMALAPPTIANRNRGALRHAVCAGREQCPWWKEADIYRFRGRGSRTA